MAKKTANKPPAVKSKGVNVEFLISPTGLLKMAYSAGDIALVSKDQADLLIKDKMAKKV